MKGPTAIDQGRLFLFDLSNCAKEYWFKEGEGWEVSIVSAKDKINIEKKYRPVIAVSLPGEIILETLHIVKKNLKQKLSDKEQRMDQESVQKEHLQYLVAYNSMRMRV